jgi:ubiquinone/menaquinone biosynthesis C-methylase UbiE
MSLRRTALALTLWIPLAGCKSTAATPKPAGKPAPQAATQTDQPRPTSTPYAGDLSIFEYPDRAKKLEIDRVMTLLKIAPGKTVADIGAGSGWFTVRAAKRVGPKGLVYAEDINPEATRFIDDRAQKEHYANIQTVLGTPDDDKLPAASVDAVLLLKVYHEIARPIPFMEHLRASLRPGAHIGIIDRNGTGSGTDHGVPQATLEREMSEAGYQVVERYDFTKKDGQDYFLIFTVK